MHQIHLPISAELADWRMEARRLLSLDVPPEGVLWTQDATLLPVFHPASRDGPADESDPRVPRAFLDHASWAACFRDPGRWPLLYRILWRLTHGESRLLDLVVDDDVHALLAMEKAVRRDAHKMKAFVRFRKVIATREGEGDHYVAWHRPDQLIVRKVAPWFRGRFGAMRWTILTADASATWDGAELTYGPGVPRSAAPQGDELEDLWRTYYASVFNPARLKLRAMRREMPVRHWPTLPETELIPRLIREAPARVEEMMKRQANVDGPSGRTPGRTAKGATTRIPASETNPANCPTGSSAAEFIPHTTSLPVLREAAQNCRGCQIYCNATQAVFGEGPRDATVMFVGEQPGDQEDKAGKPFVGPAGQVLNDALAAAGVPRDEAYVTNAVKHFKWEPRGTRRLHSKPSAREVSACRPWLETEINIIKPTMIVCLGATAAQSLMGPAFRITKERGKPITGTQWAPWVMATVHPSSILRIPERDLREQAIEDFVKDLKVVAKQLKAAASLPRGRAPNLPDGASRHGDVPSLFDQRVPESGRRHRA